MREVTNAWDGRKETAYQDADLERLYFVFEKATQLWIDEWERQGQSDEGTCCGGKGIQLLYIGKGCRNGRYKNVVSCGWVQGNVSAQKTVGPALEYLKSNGVEATYNDGWMD